ncbi:HNH endonuclease [Acinetobacter baumannii]|uniref:HNH endonuclease n=1 Tax=Acinetobacter baumannii TaxID=470 RepID=UPI0022B5D041|nr:HNH endonuclease [Acinetobacter baumannii]
MAFSPNDLQEHLTNYYGFKLKLKPSGEPNNKKVHRLQHPTLDFTLHIQDEDYTQANFALPFIPKYTAKIDECLSIKGVSGGYDSNRSCFQGYPDKEPLKPTTQKQALCFTIHDRDALPQFMKLMFALEPTKDIQASIDDLPLTQTEKEALVKLRLGQGKFREKLLEYWDGSCAVTGCTLKALLVSSHIKPWSIDKDSRLDPFNGLLLSPTLDRAFDQRLISFNDDRSIILSPVLTNIDLELLHLSSDLKLRKLDKRHLPYLAWHRANLVKE